MHAPLTPDNIREFTAKRRESRATRATTKRRKGRAPTVASLASAWNVSSDALKDALLTLDTK